MLSRGNLLGGGEVERLVRLERLASEPTPTPRLEVGLGSLNVFNEISGNEA